MDKNDNLNIFFNYLLDSTPFLICVVDQTTKELVYSNEVAVGCFQLMTDAQTKSFIVDTIKTGPSIKFFESTQESENGRWFYINHQNIKWHDGSDCILITGADHSQSITNEQLLTIAAYTDSLTGIYNRKIGLEMLSKFINELKADSPPFTVCFLDLDDLKHVNDKYGHNAGDQYIITVADLVKQSIRKSDVFARMGGDEFLVIFPKCEEAIVSNIMLEVDNMLNTLNESSSQQQNYSISYGIVQVNVTDEYNIESLLSDAGALMYKMKGEYKMMRVLA